MSIADKITQLDTIRSNIRTALTDKGVTADTHDFADFAADVGSIQVGGAEAVIVASACGANATVTATLNGDSYTALSDSNGIANIFVPSTGTYNISSTGTTVVKNCIVSATHTFVYIEMTDAKSIIDEAVFYTDFRNRISNLNNNSSYTISGTAAYTSEARPTLITANKQFTFSTDFQNVIKTTSSPLTIMAIIKSTSASPTNDKGGRIFDFYDTSWRLQGVSLMSTAVTGYYNNGNATTIKAITLNNWNAIVLRKNQGATTKTISVYEDGGTFTSNSMSDVGNYGGGYYFLRQNSGMEVNGNCAGLVCWNRNLTDDEVKQASAYLIADAFD